MGSPFWWILDIVTVLVIGYIIFSNARRGAAKVLIISIGYVISTLVAALLSAVAAQPLYEAGVQQSNCSAIRTAIEKTEFTKIYTDAIDAKKYGFVCLPIDVKTIISTYEEGKPFDVRLYEYVSERTGNAAGDQEAFTKMLSDAFTERFGKQLNDHLPRYVAWQFRENADKSPDTMRTVTEAVCVPGRGFGNAVDYIEQHFSADITTEALRIFVYMIIFSILMVIALLIAAVLQNRVYLNITKEKDRFYGGILGLIECGALLLLFTLAIRLVVVLSGNANSFLNTETIAQTKVFRWLYGWFDSTF